MRLLATIHEDSDVPQPTTRIYTIMVLMHLIYVCYIIIYTIDLLKKQIHRIEITDLNPYTFERLFKSSIQYHHLAFKSWSP